MNTFSYYHPTILNRTLVTQVFINFLLSQTPFQCFGILTCRLPLWEECFPDPFSMEPNVSLVRTQLHDEHLLAAYRATLNLLTTGNTGSLSSAPSVSVGV